MGLRIQKSPLDPARSNVESGHAGALKKGVG